MAFNKYSTAQICKNGHIVNDDIEMHPLKKSVFCPLCSEKTITTCPHCGKPIRGNYYTLDNLAEDPIIYLGADTDIHFKETILNSVSLTEAPAYCPNCGKPYPWTEAFLKNADEMVDMFDELSTEQKQQLKETFPDLIVKNPRSELAALKAAKLINSLTSFGKDIFVKLLQDNVVDSLFALMHLKS